MDRKIDICNDNCTFKREIGLSLSWISNSLTSTKRLTRKKCKLFHFIGTMYYNTLDKDKI